MTDSFAIIIIFWKCEYSEFYSNLKVKRSNKYSSANLSLSLIYEVKRNAEKIRALFCGCLAIYNCNNNIYYCGDFYTLKLYNPLIIKNIQL